MNEEKINRIKAAVTVSTVLLIAILLAVAVYQLIMIPLMTKEYNDLKKEENYYKEQIENAKNELDYLKSEQGLQDKAFEMGWYYPD